MTHRATGGLPGHWPGTLWRPTSPCDAGCRGGTGAGSVALPIRLARLAGLAGALLFGIGLLPVLPLLGPSRRGAIAGVWARTLLRALGIRLAARGRLPQRRALLVANHISWLDTVAVLAVAPSRMLAKREVRGWPLIGVLAAAAGTVFVDRSRPRDLPRTVAEVADALRAGGVVAAFPEGTTWCGASNGRFRPALFQAAIDAGAQVVPVTLGYRAGGRRSAAPAFVGDDSLLSSLRRVVALRGLEVTVQATTALHPVPTADRRVLARIAELAVRGTDLTAHLPELRLPVPAPALPPARSLDLAA